CALPTICVQATVHRPDLPYYPTRRSSDLCRQFPVGRYRLRCRPGLTETRAGRPLKQVGFTRPGQCGITKQGNPSLGRPIPPAVRSEEHTSELQSRENLVCRLLLEKTKQCM